jgi:hypothetical protein
VIAAGLAATVWWVNDALTASRVATVRAELERRGYVDVTVEPAWWVPCHRHGFRWRSSTADGWACTSWDKVRSLGVDGQEDLLAGRP